MDLPRLGRRSEAHLSAARSRCVARDTPEPSVLSHELLNSAVYTFLDDAPLEERRTRAVYTRRATEPRSADDLGALDPAAIERVREEAWPVANTADELHDALMVAGYHRGHRSWQPHWPSLLEELGDRAVKTSGRVVRRWSARTTTESSSLASRLEVLGPVAATGGRAAARARRPGPHPAGQIHVQPSSQWCDRRLLARIHRYTLNSLRAEIEPVTAAEFMRFLLALAARRRRGPGARAPRAWRRWSSSSRASSSRRRPGRTTCCRRASPTTSRSRSTGCA